MESNKLKEAYKMKIEAELAELDAKIKKLKAQTATAEAEALIKAKKHMRNLEMKREQMKALMKELRESGDKAWTELKTGIENALDDLKIAFSKAFSELS